MIWKRLPRCIAVIAVLMGTVATGPRLLAQAAPGDAERLQSMLSASRYTAIHVADPAKAVWTISQHKDSLGDFRVITTTDKGIMVTFVTVAKKANIRRTLELDQRMLKMSYDYDYVKVGYDSDDDAFVRIDAVMRVVDVRLVNDIIEQVANVSEELSKILKPYLLK